MPFNLSATLNASRLFLRPSLCLPHYQIERFDQLPIPLNSETLRAIRSPYLLKLQREGKVPEAAKLDIRAIVLDKDNCFAEPEGKEVWHEYKVCIKF